MLSCAQVKTGDRVSTKVLHSTSILDVEVSPDLRVFPAKKEGIR